VWEKYSILTTTTDKSRSSPEITLYTWSHCSNDIAHYANYMYIY